MPIDFQSLLQPISQEHPAGEDCRLSPDYTAIFNEIDKLTRAKDVGSPDWVKIETVSAQVLKEQSKDFLVAGWIAAAWLEKQGLDGIAAGLGLFNGFFDQYWDTAFPPLNRIRGRRNAISWWVDRASTFLTTPNIPPITQELFDSLSQGVAALDKNLADKDSDAPSIGDFIRAIKSLAVVEPPPAAAPQVTSTDATQSPEAPVQSDAANNTPVAADTTSSSAIDAPPSGLKNVATLSSLDDVENALSSVQPYIGDVAQVLMKLDPYNPLAVHLIRFAARGAILSLPPATAGATLIPEPPLSEVQMFQSVCAATDAKAIIEFCEARITQYPFWLDLDYQSALAYGSIGASAIAMQEAVIDEALSFVSRLPGIESLTFGGQKMPFADVATQNWLTDCANKRSGGGVADSLDQAKNTASQMLGSGQAEGAMGVLQAYIDNTRVARDQFRARIELLQMVFGLKKDANLLPLVAPLIEECQTRKIAEWEPNLAMSAWKLKVQALLQANKGVDLSSDSEKMAHYQQEMNEALEQISKLNFVEATRQI